MLAARRVQFDPAPLYAHRIRVRRASGAALTERLARLVESSLYNARTQAQIAPAAPDEEMARLIRWQLVDGAFSVLHKIAQFLERAARAEHGRRVRESGFYRFLWDNAVGLRQHRRVLSVYLRRLLER